MTDSSPNLNYRQKQKQLDAMIALGVKVFIACAILMWSVFNVSFNILAFRANEQAEQAWLMTAGLVFLTCVVPFLFGLWMLFRTLGKTDRQS